MAHGGSPSVFSVISLLCAAAVVLGYGPMLAIVAMVCAALAKALDESLAGLAVVVALVVLVLAFVLPPSLVLGRV